jgi:putative transposase
METIHSRKMIRDTNWKQLEVALTKAKHSRAGAPAAMTDRDFIEAVLYLNRTGCPWRDLPVELGNWHSVYMRFRRWQERGAASDRRTGPRREAIGSSF